MGFLFLRSLQAKEIFKKICPDEEFLPAVPNPEDILWDEMLPVAEENEAGFGPENRSDVDEASGDTIEEPGSSEASEGVTVGPGTIEASDCATEDPEASGALEDTPGPGATGASRDVAEEPGAVESSEDATDASIASGALRDASDVDGSGAIEA